MPWHSLRNATPPASSSATALTFGHRIFHRRLSKQTFHQHLLYLLVSCWVYSSKSCTLNYGMLLFMTWQSRAVNRCDQWPCGLVILFSMHRSFSFKGIIFSYVHLLYRIILLCCCTSIIPKIASVIGQGLVIWLFFFFFLFPPPVSLIRMPCGSNSCLVLLFPGHLAIVGCWFIFESDILFGICYFHFHTVMWRKFPFNWYFNFFSTFSFFFFYSSCYLFFSCLSSVFDALRTLLKEH